MNGLPQGIETGQFMLFKPVVQFAFGLCLVLKLFQRNETRFTLQMTGLAFIQSFSRHTTLVFNFGNLVLFELFIQAQFLRGV